MTPPSVDEPSRLVSGNEARTRALYEQVILEHNKSPRNFRKLEPADGIANGLNPLCGDRLTVYLKLDGESRVRPNGTPRSDGESRVRLNGTPRSDGDVIADISFEGSGCAISKSSASIMTTLLKGKTRKEAEDLFVVFHRMITSTPDTPVDEKALGRLAIFAGVREYPIRIKCATLAWHAMLAALDGKGKSISTE